MAEKRQDIDPSGWYRVRSKTTKHESTIAGMSIREDEHEILDKPAVDDLGSPLPAKPHLTPSQARAQAAENEETG